mmetsp:Transcript_12516/g.29268  ORF Transcript_12516/g.29268 Transcript_12516/m.29268 type:complete len:403 (-) Transcript_12516:603-1811(-)
MFSIPDSKAVIDLILSKTQRKTPTIVHRKFSLQKIRQFYMRKIKFFEQNFKFFIEKILKNFPLIDQLHPFFCDLLNILFNRNNYKIALNQLNKAKIKISKLSQTHLKFLKYGNSLYNCKQLKKIGFGKMCKEIKKLNTPLIFLEKIRCQIKKIPKIDPHRKILLVGGSSNTGKSCLMNKLTRVNDLKKNPKKKTKFLMLGHLINKFWTWQIIDTPGITNWNLNSLTSIEMQFVVALMNLNYRILYLIDLNSEFFPKIQSQVKIFIELRKLLKKKERIFILAKTDLGWEKSIDRKKKAFIGFLNSFSQKRGLITKSSFHDEIGILEIRNQSFFLRNKTISEKHYFLIKKKKFFKTISAENNSSINLHSGQKPKMDLTRRKIPTNLFLVKKNFVQTWKSNFRRK